MISPTGVRDTSMDKASSWYPRLTHMRPGSQRVQPLVGLDTCDLDQSSSITSLFTAQSEASAVYASPLATSTTTSWHGWNANDTDQVWQEQVHSSTAACENVGQVHVHRQAATQGRVCDTEDRTESEMGSPLKGMGADISSRKHGSEAGAGHYMQLHALKHIIPPPAPPCPLCLEQLLFLSICYTNDSRCTSVACVLS